MKKYEILIGDVLEQLATLPDESVQCVVTSPPYWGLRDYGVDGQIGLEETFAGWLEKLVATFREVRRVLRPDGTVWLNVGDSYANNSTPGGGDPTIKTRNIGESKYQPTIIDGLPPKNLIGQPWRLAFALQDDGWWLRSDIIWAKPNPMPESVTDRPTKSHEHIFLLTKSAKYFYDADAVREKHKIPEDTNRPRGKERGENKKGVARFGYEQRILNPSGRNLRDVWTITTQSFNEWTRTYHLERVEPGVFSDDMKHIVSPNCQYHEGLFDSLAKKFCDGRASDLLNHIKRTCHHHEKSLSSDSFPTEKSHDAGSALDNSGYSFPEYVPFAKHHSTEIRKKARDLSTNPSCRLFAEILSHIADKQERQSFFAQHVSTYGNSILQGETAVRLLDQIPYHNVDKSSFNSLSNADCSCLFYREITKKSSHFATFPEEIPKRCILAGTSEKGCCPECGAAWVRIVERKTATPGQNPGYLKNCTGRNDGDRAGTFINNESKTIGWQPSCNCGNEKPVPCTVLDPFSGSGTTGLVAVKYGRKYIGIELNPEYAEMSIRRIDKVAKQQLLF